jgi:uncharacterized protein
MIKIHVERDERGQLERILIKGHAYYDDPGKDIVCAAVSGISVGLVNAVEKLLGVRVHAADDHPGKLDCRVPRDLADPKKIAEVRLLLEAMLVSLHDVADEAPAFVKIFDKQ